MRPSLERKHRLTLRFRSKLLYLSCAVSNSYETELEVWLLLGLPAVLKIYAILLKYPTFSYFYGQNRYKIRVAVHCSIGI